MLFRSGANTVNVLYGDPGDPSDPGSGGGSDNGAAGNGGGVIRLHARDLVLDGNLIADGGDGAGWGGGGSGGSIRILTRFISGAGGIQAHGGDGVGSIGGGGGGGRIAVYYEDIAGLAPERILAEGGEGFGFGAVGTVVLSRSDYIAPSASGVDPVGSVNRPIFTSIEFVPRAPGTAQPSGGGAGSEIVVRWRAPRGGWVGLEQSSDLVHWEAAPMSAERVDPETGLRELRVPFQSGQWFYRLRFER